MRGQPPNQPGFWHRAAGGIVTGAASSSGTVNGALILCKNRENVRASFRNEINRQLIRFNMAWPCVVSAVVMLAQTNCFYVTFADCLRAAVTYVGTCRAWFLFIDSPKQVARCQDCSLSFRSVSGTLAFSLT